MENTHNFHGGRVVPIKLLHDLQQVCSDREIALHLDGARIWNAVVAAEVDPVAYGTACDSLMFCFSKGLGAPVGSMLLGTHVFVAEARRIRKRLGGGMRQVGVLAAAAQLALEEGPAQLKEDHRRARRLAEGWPRCPGPRSTWTRSRRTSSSSGPRPGATATGRSPRRWPRRACWPSPWPTWGSGS